MGIPRRPNQSSASIDLRPEMCQLVENQLDVSEAKEDDTFIKLVEAFENLNKPPSSREIVSAHPLFDVVMQEYLGLSHALMFPGSRSSGTVEEISSHDEEISDTDDDAELTEGLLLWIEMLRKRKNKAVEFALMHKRFLQEYAEAVKDLEAAEPALKGTNLADKIAELQDKMKRKYGDKVDELQRECCNKRRRANLSEEATQTLRAWFAKHKSNPYPTDQDKKLLADKCGITEVQVCNWFVNVRKRYWKDKA